jgi:acyl-[acyl-carrier-protein]-phospholipid O-acyltransferase/long-chain-fatty-acid--[acyl-carrier-protein] ligase
LNTAFGLSLNFWLPLISGIKVSYHNDLDRNFSSNIIFLTPKIAERIMNSTFDQQLSEFKYVINVADYLNPDIDLEFDDRFHINILESFGQTELSPLLSLNIPDIDLPAAKQIGRKSGTVGHPLPNICVKIINLESGETLGVGAFGTVLVKGANVFLEYWNNPYATNEVKNEGWYNTGVIGAIDLDGFLQLRN